MISSSPPLAGNELQSRPSLPALVVIGTLSTTLISIFLFVMWLTLNQNAVFNNQRVEIETARSALRGETEVANRLRAEKLAVEASIGELAQQRDNVAVSIDQLKSQVRDLDIVKRQRDQASKERDEAQKSQKDAETAKMQMDAANKQAKDELASVRSAMAVLQADTESAKSAKLAMEGEIVKLRTERVAVEGDTKTALARKQDAETQAGQSVQKLILVRKDVDQTQRDVETARVAATTTKAEALAAEARRADAEATLQRLRERIGAAQGDVDETEARASRLREELKKVQSEQARLQGIVLNATPAEAEALKKVASARLAADDAEKARAATVLALQAVQAQLEAAKVVAGKLVDTRAELTTLEKQVTDQQAVLAKSKSEASVAQQQSVDAKADLAKTQLIGSNLNNEIKVLSQQRVQLAEVGASLAAATQQNLAIASEIGQKRADLAKILGDIDQAAGQRQTLQQTVLSLGQELQNEKSRLAALKDEILRLEATTAALSSERAALMRTIASDESRLVDLKAQAKVVGSQTPTPLPSGQNAVTTPDTPIDSQQGKPQ